MRSFIPLLIVSIYLWSCTSDNESSIINQAPLNFSEVMTFEVDTLELDMVSSVIENSFYITYSPDNGLNENVLKYDLTTLSQNDLTHPDTSESRQIEIINDIIYSISSNDVYKYDLNLGNLNTAHVGYGDYKRYSRLTSYNDDILMVSGLYYGIRRFDTTSETYVTPYSPPPNEPRFQNDGEIYNDNIYTFGGWITDGISNEILIYNILTDTWDQESLPYDIFESYTDTYNDNIFVTGNKDSNQTNSFLAEYDPISNSYTDILSNLDLANITIRGITILNDDVFIAYADLVSPMPSIIPIKVVKATLN